MNADFPGLLDCVHCGLCLDACPTYRLTSDESDSPRGRIALMRGAAEGRLRREDITESIDRCVLCRACEPVCPSSVGYHQLVEQHREGHAPPLVRWSLRRILPSRRALHAAALALRMLRAAGLLGLAERFGPRRLRAMAGAVPAAPSRFVPPPGRVYPAHGERRGRVGLHLGCVNAEFLGDVLRDTVDLLCAQGYEVLVPEQPACCGSLHAHSGDARAGRELAAATLRAFETDVDAVIVPSAGCAAHLHESAPEAPVREPLLFLHEHGLRRPGGRVSARVALDPPCHLLHVLHAGGEVAELLREVEGVELLEHAEADLCCGAGGIAFVRRPEIGGPLLERKIDRVEACGAEVVASGNPGCLLRLESGLRRRQSNVEAVHPVSLLARACRDGVVRRPAAPS